MSAISLGEDEDEEYGHNTRQDYFSNVPPSSFMVARLCPDLLTKVCDDLIFRLTTKRSISTILLGTTLPIYWAPNTVTGDSLKLPHVLIVRA